MVDGMELAQRVAEHESSEAGAVALWGFGLFALGKFIDLVKFLLDRHRNRVPMMRQADKTATAMAEHLLKMSEQQERTAKAVERMSNKWDDVSGLIKLLTRDKE